MSLLNKASLIQIPSGYKDGTLYSAKPTNGDGDFTLSRGSNLAATRVNSEGLIEKGRENLFFASDTSDSTAGRAIRGSSTTIKGVSGFLYSDDAGNPNINKSIAGYSTGFATFSIYVDTTNANTIQLNFAIDGSAINGTQAKFNATTKTWNSIVENTSYVSSGSTQLNFEDLGDNVFRLSIGANFTPSGSTYLPVVYFGTGNTNVAIGGGQVEKGLVATDYIETTTTTAQAGILEDMPRLDYSGGGCPSLLLEPQRTNLDTQSEYIAGWNAFSNLTRTANYAESPEGVDNATRLEFTGNGYTYNGNTPSQVSGSTYTMSCYAKRNDSGTQNFGFFVDGSGAVNSEMTLTSEWQRFTYTYTASNTSRQGLAGISGADVSVYGFQIEKDASYPTSYIPTYGSSVTRSQDLTTADTSSFYTDSSEGTLFTELSFPLAADGNYNGWFFWDGSNYNRIVLQRRGDTGRGQIEVRINNTTQASVISSSVITLEDNHKMLVKWDGNVFTLFIDGVNVGSDTSTDTYSGTDLNELASRPTYNAANIKQAIIFPTALTSNDCKVLTGTNYTSFASMASTLNYTQYE